MALPKSIPALANDSEDRRRAFSKKGPLLPAGKAVTLAFTDRAKGSKEPKHRRQCGPSFCFVTRLAHGVSVQAPHQRAAQDTWPQSTLIAAGLEGRPQALKQGWEAATMPLLLPVATRQSRLSAHQVLGAFRKPLSSASTTEGRKRQNRLLTALCSSKSNPTRSQRRSPEGIKPRVPGRNLERVDCTERLGFQAGQAPGGAHKVSLSAHTFPLLDFKKSRFFPTLCPDPPHPPS